MAPGIKVCPSCGGLYTGSTERCLGCIVRALPAAAQTPALTRAQRRAADRAERARELAMHQTETRRERKRKQTEKRAVPQPLPRPAQPMPPTASAAPKLPQKPKPKRPNTNPPGLVQTHGSVRMPRPTPSLGALSRAEGTTRTEVGPSGRMIKKLIVQCSCGGENANCFKCDGTGYCETEIASDFGAQVPTDPLRSRSKVSGTAETHFSGDERGGGTYGIRERGRFGSNPLHDDHDE